MSKLYRISLLAWCSVAAFGGQSLQTSSSTGSATVVPVQGDQHWDVRVHRLSLPANESYLAYFGGLELEVDQFGSIFLADGVDTFIGPNNYVNVAIPSGSTDFMIRAQRCAGSDAGHCTWVGGPFLELEVWNIDGTGYNSAISPITATQNLSSGAVLIGNAGNVTANLAYVRWCAGTTPMNTNVAPTVPPYPNGNMAPPTCNVIGDWELEGNGNDSGPNHYNLNFSGGSPSYTTTPTAAPSCVLPPTSFSTAFPIQPTAAMCGSLQDEPTLHYVWSYLGTGADGVTQTVSFSDINAANPVITGAIRGSLNLQVVAIDIANQSTVAQVHDGVVVTDGNHVVSSAGNADIDKLYMPMIQWGYNPYPYFDHAAKAMGDFFGPLLSSTFMNVWDTVQTGTVACTSGNSTCTFSGANAQTMFCSGGTSSDSSFIVVWYNSGANRAIYGINGCPTASTITLSSNYRDATLSGANYSRMTQTDIANWIGPSSNANYYDNVAAYLAMYYRSGIDTYYSYGKTLGMRWWKMPFIDQGRTCDDGGVYPCTANRIRAMLGLVTLALDGTIPNFWPAVDTFWMPNYEYQITALLHPPLTDLRESSAAQAMVAYDALFDTGSAQTTALAALSTSVANFWSGQQLPNGSFLNLSYGTAPWNGNAPGTVTVANGSASVSGSGTNWNSGMMNGNYFITLATNNPTCTLADNFDATPYFQPTVNGPTSLTLPLSYAGAIASGRYWQVGNVVGCGVQPFMMGYNAHSMYLTYEALTGHDATNAARAKTVILNDASFIENYGFNGLSAAPLPAGIPVNGLFYGLAFPEDVPNPWADAGNLGPCGSGLPTQMDCNIQGIRFLAAEVMSALGYARLLGDTSTIPGTLYSALYGGLGGNGADQHYVWQYYGSPQGSGEATFFVKPKDFGFGMGWGNGAVLPAVGFAQPGTPGSGDVTGGIISSGVIP